MDKVTLQFYVNRDVKGVVLTPQNSIHAKKSVAEAISEYHQTTEDYSKMGGTWAASVTLFKIEMETHIGICEVVGEDFLDMMKRREHKAISVGNMAAPLRIAELTDEEIAPYLPDCVSLLTGKKQSFDLGDE